MANRIQIRRGTAAEWAADNPILADGEPGVERDTGKQKFGNGVTAWDSLPYASQGPTGPAGVADDASVQDLIADPGSATRGELNATFVPGNPTLVVTYNGDGSVASTTENGVLTTFTYNTDGTVATQTRAGVTKTFTYDANGNVTGAA
jgi:YD repeat-containing protein